MALLYSSWQFRKKHRTREPLSLGDIAQLALAPVLHTGRSCLFALSVGQAHGKVWAGGPFFKACFFSQWQSGRIFRIVTISMQGLSHSELSPSLCKDCRIRKNSLRRKNHLNLERFLRTTSHNSIFVERLLHRPGQEIVCHKQCQIHCE